MYDSLYDSLPDGLPGYQLLKPVHLLPSVQAQRPDLLYPPVQTSVHHLDLITVEERKSSVALSGIEARVTDGLDVADWQEVRAPDQEVLIFTYL